MLLTRCMRSSFFIVIILVAQISPSSQSSPQKKCPRFDPHLNSVIKRSFFMPVRTETYKGASSINSVRLVDIEFQRNCDESNITNLSNRTSLYKDFEEQLLEIQWRFQYHQLFSCIRIELDLGPSLARFKDVFNYEYYMFSYREFSKQNLHLNRNPIVNRVNSLVLNKVEMVPYVVCVTFFATNDLNYRLGNNDNNSNKTCKEYQHFLLTDRRMHDIDLCLDINLNSKHLTKPAKSNFLTKVINPELIMVIFLIVFLITMLVTITFAHYLIEKPRKRRMLSALRHYLHRKSLSHPETDSLLESSQAVHRGSNGPEIVVTDFSSTDTKDQKLDDLDLLESDQIIRRPSLFQANMHVNFSIDEEDEEVDEKDLIEDKDETDAVKSIMHLLDDKPWQSPQSNLNRRDSRLSTYKNS